MNPSPDLAVAPLPLTPPPIAAAEANSIFKTFAPLYWAAGLQVIPLMHKDKRPAVGQWQTWCQQKIPDNTKAEWLERYPDGNIGLPAGPASGLCFIDIDVEEPTLLALIEKHLPPSPWRRVGKKGCVLAYKYNGAKSFKIKTGADQRPLVEFFSTSGQVVLPPSIHPDTGQPYQSTRHLYEVMHEIPEISPDIEKLLRTALKVEGKVKLDISGISNISDRVSAGGRDTALIKHAGLFSIDILRGRKNLKEAFDGIADWVDTMAEAVEGDQVDLEKGQRRIVEFLIRDVRQKNLVLPKGWDDGITDEQKEHLGLNGLRPAFNWNQRDKKLEKAFAPGTIAKWLSADGEEEQIVSDWITKAKKRGYSPEEIVIDYRCFKHLRVMKYYENEDQFRDEVQRAFTKADRPKLSSETIFRYYPSEVEMNERRTIKLAGGLLPQTVIDAQTALIEAGTDIFRRGEHIVRPGDTVTSVLNAKEVTSRYLSIVSPVEMRVHLTAAAQFEKYDARSREPVPVDCPLDIAQATLALSNTSKLRPLVAEIDAPTLRPDGTLLDKPGYDADTGLYYHPHGQEYPPIPESPTREDALAALEVLRGPICKFPFASKEAESVAIAAMITGTIRRTLPGAPGFVADGDQPAVGKGKLIDVCSIITTGSRVSPITMGSNDEEFEKRLGSEFVAGKSLISIDNITDPLGGNFLEAVTTSPEASIRILGKTKNVTTVTNAMLFANGNGVRFTGDGTWRRFLRSQLDSKHERPSAREFEFDPVDVAKRDRPKLVVAALTILKAYHCAGSPPQRGIPMGSYEPWCRRVRDALLWIDLPDPVLTAQPSEDDPKREALAAIITGWNEFIGTERSASAIEAAKIAQEPGKGSFLDALLMVARPRIRSNLMWSKEVDTGALGKWLSSNKMKPHSGLRFFIEGQTGGTNRWRLQRVH